MASAIILSHGPRFILDNAFGTSTYKTVLTNAAVSAAHANISDLTQIANGNGYTTDGVASSALTTTAAGLVTTPQVTLTPSGGGFSYRSIYLARASDGALFPVAWDENASISVTVSRLLAFSQNAGILQLTS